MATAPTKLVPLSELHESPSNPRKAFGDLTELTDSIKSVGILQPLVARHVGKQLELVVGHRRLRAAKKAGLKEVPVQVRDLTDAEALEVQLVENVQREDIHPMEEAEAYDQLQKEYSYSVDQVADRVGKTRATVYARMKLLDLEPPARKAFLAGKLNPSVALDVARFRGARHQELALSRVSAPNRFGDSMPAREAAAALKRLRGELEQAEKKATAKTSGEKLVQVLLRRTRAYAMGRVVEAVERRQELQPNDLRLVLSALTDGGVPAPLLDRRGIGSDKQLAARVQKMPAAELRGLLVELALTRWVDEQADDAHDRLKAMCKAFNLDFRDMERTTRELIEKEDERRKAEALFTRRSG